MKYPKNKEFNQIVFLDFETNGKHPLDDPLTMYGVITDKSLNIIKEEHFKFRPSGEWNPDSAKIHGISYSDAKSYPRQTVETRRLLEWLPDRSVLACHALNLGGYFDWGVMHGLFLKQDVSDQMYQKFVGTHSTVDYLREAVRQTLIPPIKTSIEMKNGKTQIRPSYKLNLWADRFDIELNHHDAKSDTYACYEIYKILANL